MQETMMLLGYAFDFIDYPENSASLVATALRLRPYSSVKAGRAW
jgi:hypothetical protein